MSVGYYGVYEKGALKMSGDTEDGYERDGLLITKTTAT